VLLKAPQGATVSPANCLQTACKLPFALDERQLLCTYEMIVGWFSSFVSL